MRFSASARRAQVTRDQGQRARLPPFAKEMIMSEQKKIFAFKLADKKEQTEKAKWRAREGVSVAGCSDPGHVGDFREGDRGLWC